MPEKIVGVTEYAKMRGCKPQNIYNQLYAGRKLPGVLSFTRSGSAYMLLIDTVIVNSKELKTATVKRSRKFATIVQR